MYVFWRVLAFVAAFAILEVMASAGWLLGHRADRRALAEIAQQIEETWERLLVEREWLEERAALGAAMDAASERLGRGRGGFGSRSAYDSARAAYARGVASWNEQLEEQVTRNRRWDSLAMAHDSLARAWDAAYRRAYPGWLVLPRPRPPESGGGSK